MWFLGLVYLVYGIIGGVYFVYGILGRVYFEYGILDGVYFLWSKEFLTQEIMEFLCPITYKLISGM